MKINNIFMFNNKFSYISCSLDHIEIRNLFSIEAPIFENLLSLFNISLYLTVGLILFIAIVMNILAVDYDIVRSKF